MLSVDLLKSASILTKSISPIDTGKVCQNRIHIRLHRNNIGTVTVLFHVIYPMYLDLPAEIKTVIQSTRTANIHNFTDIVRAMDTLYFLVFIHEQISFDRYVGE